MKKIKHLNANTVQNNLPAPSEAFFTATMTRLEALASREEKPMKHKTFSSILIAAIVVVMLAATAFAAYTLTRSKQADAISQARQALMADYGLTSETMGLFFATAAQRDDGWTIVFQPEGYHPSLLGEYSVRILPDETPKTSWTYDAVDPATWEDGNLDSPVWGQPQMVKALRDPATASEISLKMDWSSVPTRPTPLVNPDDIKEGDVFYLGELMRVGQPGANDIPQEEAKALAIQALSEDTSIPEKAFETAEVTFDFCVRETGNPIWAFHFYLVYDDIEQGCAAVLDARTGEILLTSVVTGGNG